MLRKSLVVDYQDLNRRSFVLSCAVVLDQHSKLINFRIFFLIRKVKIHIRKVKIHDMEQNQTVE